jgi:LmbE family N-acetylglucosaminyl deacetylase
VSVLVVAAHPDDEVLGAGGTIARLAADGVEVDVAILGEGITSRYAARGEADAALLDELAGASRRAADRLGVRELVLERLPDNRFDSVPLLDVVHLVEALVARFAPDVIYTHRAGDVNVDHDVVHRAVLAATRPVPGSCVRSVYAFEIPSSTEWAFGSPFSPAVFVDIADTLDAKVAAMQLYETEARPFPHPRSPEALEALARTRGAAAGLAAAEAFELVREIV